MMDPTNLPRPYGEKEAPSVSSDEKRAVARRAARLFAVSFLALFLELMLIRWVPAVAKIVAYYANLMLISSFLGLGMGAMVARRGWRLFRWFPLLLAVTVGFLLLSRNVLLPGSLVELRFFSNVPGLVNYLVLVGIFVLNTALFVPLGEQVGQLFESLPPLRAYMWDLGGSFCGTVAFGVFSLLYFSPLLGILGVMLAYLVLTERPQRLPTLALFALTALGVSQGVDPNTIWSPYQNFTIRESLGSPTVSEPPERLREMQDPPFYMVSVNQNFYQSHGSVDPSRYSRPIEFLETQGDLGQIPYTVHGNPRNVLVVGAGGGPDVEGALLSGATHVDAVDIDPATIRISRRFNSSGVYDDERVTTHIDDARAFFRRATPGYDLVVFGFLDSQALSSSMANIRLDGFRLYGGEHTGCLSARGRPGDAVPSVLHLTPAVDAPQALPHGRGGDGKGAHGLRGRRYLEGGVHRAEGPRSQRTRALHIRESDRCGTDRLPHRDGRLALLILGLPHDPVRLPAGDRHAIDTFDRGGDCPEATGDRGQSRSLRISRRRVPTAPDQEHRRCLPLLRGDLVRDHARDRRRTSDGDGSQLGGHPSEV